MCEIRSDVHADGTNAICGVTYIPSWRVHQPLDYRLRNQADIHVEVELSTELMIKICETWPVRSFVVFLTVHDTVFEKGPWLCWKERMPTNWAGVAGFQPCCDAGGANGMSARKAHFNLDSALLTTEGTVFFQADAATFPGIVDAVVHLKELVEEGFSHLENRILVAEVLGF